MKFTCLQENLSKGLSVVNKAISARVSLPILSNILITTDGGRVKLSSFNMETGITTYVGASVENEGSITVPAKLFTEFVSNLGTDTITAELKDLTLHLASSKSKAKFNGMDASGYPELPQLSDSQQVISIEPKVFCDAIKSVGFSSSTDDSRPVLQGILLSLEEGMLTLVTADGYRLSEKKIKIEGKPEDFSVVVPAKTLIEVSRLFSSATSPIKFAIDKNDSLALFESEDILISTRIIEGAFPDYKKLISEESSFSAEFNPVDFLEAVKLTNVFAKEKTNNAMTLIFDPEGRIEFSSTTSETGQNVSEIEATVTGDKLAVSFNAKFLLDYLNNISAKKMFFGTNGNSLPCIFRTDDSTDYLHIIMPLRIQD